MTTMFDTCTLIAVLRNSDAHHQWSVDQLNSCRADGPIVMVDVIYSELSVTMTKDQVDQAIADLAVDRLPSDDEALFRAGKAFLAYKKRPGEGKKTNVLPDFLIGAAADTASIALVTANPNDFISYFPNLKVIRPPKAIKPSHKGTVA